jgi:hypothetical protein
MKFKFSDHKDTVVDWAFFAIVAKHEKDSPGFVESLPRENLEVQLTINGIEMDFGAFLNRWSDEVYRMVEERAEELANTKVSDVLDKLRESTEETCEKVSTLAAKVIKSINPSSCTHGVVWSDFCRQCSTND